MKRRLSPDDLVEIKPTASPYPGWGGWYVGTERVGGKTFHVIEINGGHYLFERAEFDKVADAVPVDPDWKEQHRALMIKLFGEDSLPPEPYTVIRNTNIMNVQPENARPGDRVSFRNGGTCEIKRIDSGRVDFCKLSAGLSTRYMSRKSFNKSGAQITRALNPPPQPPNAQPEPPPDPAVA